MTHSASEMGLRDCVPVFRAGKHVQNLETHSFSRRLSDAKLAINHLVHLGWSVGCDGELLPPRWFRGHVD